MGSDTLFKLGINGLGRIGKLCLWNQVGQRYFSEIVVNMGRPVGRSLTDLADFIERDSTYGALHQYLYGCYADRVIEEVNDAAGTMRINGVLVRFLKETRNPKELPWGKLGVDLVVDATGKFLDPAAPADDPKGSCRGHLAAGAKKVIVSAPFKIKDVNSPLPPDAVMTVLGINDHVFDPTRHSVISNASCTTTCLAYMMKPLLDYFGARKMLSASMATVHAVTGGQEVLDRLPDAGATDLRKNRGVFNNIILTSTGAADALAYIIPEMKSIGFIAESVRIPTVTGSLVMLVATLQDESGADPISRELINEIYKRAAAKDAKGFLQYTESQNTSMDIVGRPAGAAIIEGHETRTRTAGISLDLKNVMGIPKDALKAMPDTVIDLPVTQAVVFGWYDNEMGSYTNMLCHWTVEIHKRMKG
ncbi:MAG: glyceraldehyde-3-phosphate dehydrogenase [Deltaproteobacteria bacterium]|nr:glyceraldehyde-3-phosphate dehydrogenase [Deltaproteobacteria bacterium]MBF0526311.1 glyceraldehyde-3-phosphate dehydrogenase [Deltaproteobacteria bacterium]